MLILFWMMNNNFWDKFDGGGIIMIHTFCTSLHFSWGCPQQGREFSWRHLSRYSKHGNWSRPWCWLVCWCFEWELFLRSSLLVCIKTLSWQFLLMSSQQLTSLQPQNKTGHLLLLGAQCTPSPYRFPPSGHHKFALFNTGRLKTAAKLLKVLQSMLSSSWRQLPEQYL